MTDRENRQERVLSLVRRVLILVCFLYILLYLFVAIGRIGYPFELEWMEGASVIHVKRILEGKPLYVRPGVEFVPFFYSPLYFYVSSLFSLILGLGFFPLRLLSLLSSLGCLLLLFQIVKSETGSKTMGLVSAGFFAACYSLSGYWYDIGRVDSLFLLFILSSLYLVRFQPSRRGWILAGLSMALSFLTKQSALFIFFFLALYTLIVNYRLCLFFILPALVGIGGSTVLLDLIHDGWYVTYLFKIPSRHYLVKRMFVEFWTGDLAGHIAIALCISIYGLILLGKKRSWKHLLFYCLAGVGMTGASWMSRLHVGGWLNVLMPCHAMIAVWFGVGMHFALESAGERRMTWPKIAGMALLSLGICQFALVSWNPLDQIPSRRDRKAGWDLVSMMKGIEGEIFMPYHSYLPEMAGKKSYIHAHAIFDITRADAGEITVDFTRRIRDAIQGQRFQAVILDTPRIMGDFDQYYTKERDIFGEKEVFWPVTGMKTRPEFLFVPKNP